MDKDLEKTKEFLKNHFNIDKCFDIIEKDIVIGDRKGYFLMIDGLLNDAAMGNVINVLQRFAPKKLNKTSIEDLMNQFINFPETEVTDDFNQIETMFLSGAIILFLDKEEKAIIIDAREYQIRGMNEPELEKVTRGSRDGFVETIVFNTSLIRRRIRNPDLMFEHTNVGVQSKTDVVVAYIKGLANPEYVDFLNKELDSIDIPSLIMAEKTLVELLIPKQWYNPLPKVRFTERPDVAAANLLEGHVLVIVDTSPSVIIFPVTMFSFLQHAEDYYHHPVVGTYTRLIRFFATMVAFILIPLWYLLILYEGFIPNGLQWMIPGNDSNVHFFFQLLFLQFGIDLLQISSIHTPNALAMPLGIVAGIVLSDFAISAGYLSPEAILAVAVVGLCTFAIPSSEFSYGIRKLSIFLFILTAIFRLPGFIIGLIICFIILLTTKNNSKYRYTYPLIPFNWRALKYVLFRFPFKNK